MGNIVYLSKNFIRLAPQLMIKTVHRHFSHVISISLVGVGCVTRWIPGGSCQ
jgi:hypothetical protein